MNIIKIKQIHIDSTNKTYYTTPIQLFILGILNNFIDSNPFLNAVSNIPWIVLSALKTFW
jgi:hypothetical protein